MGRKIDGKWRHPNHVAGRFGSVPLAPNKLGVPGWPPLSSLRDFVPVGAALLRVNTRSYTLSSLRDFQTQPWMAVSIGAAGLERRSRDSV
jgi:hypothetical protein